MPIMAIGSKFSFNTEVVTAAMQEDKLLWNSIRNGNQLAFSSFFKKHINNLYNYGMHLYSDRDLVKDCIQDVFTSLWQKKDSISEVELVRVYLFKSFRNLLFLKISQKKKLINIDFWEESNGDKEASFEDSLIGDETANEKLKTLHKALTHLTKRQRESVLLRYYNELDSRQVAEIMGISVEGVHNLISKSIQALRAHFK
jgi:RNA polymerase sigma factor (sigma-70 family)